jgi:hypothetical protein
MTVAESLLWCYFIGHIYMRVMFDMHGMAGDDFAFFFK